MKDFVIKHKILLIIISIFFVILAVLIYRSFFLGTLEIKTDATSKVSLYNQNNIKVFETVGSTTKKISKGVYNLSVEFSDGELYYSPVFVYSGKKTIESIEKPKSSYLKPVASINTSLFKVWPNSINYIDTNKSIVSLSEQGIKTLATDVVDAVFVAPQTGYAIKKDGSLIRFINETTSTIPISVDNILLDGESVYAWGDNKLYKIDGVKSELVWEKNNKIITSFIATKNKTLLAYIDSDPDSETQTIEITSKLDKSKKEENYQFTNTSEETNQDREEAKYIRYYFGNPESEYLVIQEGPISYLADEGLNIRSKLDSEYDQNFTWLEGSVYYSSADKLYKHRIEDSSNKLIAQTYSKKNIRNISVSEKNLYLAFSNPNDELGLYKYESQENNYRNILNYFPYYKDGCDIYYLDLNKPKLVFLNDYSTLNKSLCSNKVFNNLYLGSINNKKVEELEVNSK